MQDPYERLLIQAVFVCISKFFRIVEMIGFLLSPKASQSEFKVSISSWWSRLSEEYTVVTIETRLVVLGEFLGHFQCSIFRGL